MAKGLNECGAIWKKTNDKGKYLSISLDLDALMELTGGATGKINLTAYPIEFEKTNPNAPDFRVKFYPRTPVGAPPTPKATPKAAPRQPRRDAWDDEDEIPI